MAQLTQKAIITAFLNLLEKRPFEKITVRDIVVECGITRNTFYYHYEDVYAVLKELLATETKRASDQIGESDRLVDCFLKAMSFALEHKQAAYHLCCSSRRDELLRCLNMEADNTLKQFVDRAARGTQASEEDQQRIIRFYRCALVGILNDWVDNGMQQDLALEIQRVGLLMEGSIKSALENSAKQ